MLLSSLLEGFAVVMLVESGHDVLYLTALESFSIIEHDERTTCVV